MSPYAGRLACTGCGHVPSSDGVPPFRCPRAGTDAGDHVLAWDPPEGSSFPRAGDDDPFVRFRELMFPWHVARANCMSDDDYIELVRALDRDVSAIDGRGFVFTPCNESRALGQELGLDSGLWVKDETVNVSGSHKGRHLMGLAILLEVLERTGLRPREARERMGISSCGNAALAAATVAKATRRPLRVFAPPWSNERVVDRLRDLGAELVTCSRVEGDPPGDPCWLRFREAVAGGVFPFTVQGSENGLAVEGGRTLAWELVTQVTGSPARPIDRIALQVGGGAMASAVMQGFAIASRLGAHRLPRLHAVQTRAVHPLYVAWNRIVSGIRLRLVEQGLAGMPDPEADDAQIAAWVYGQRDSSAVATELAAAARDRAEYMRPWASEPHSIAISILDDETYDWLAIVRTMIMTGGWPVLASEQTLARARERGRATTGIDVDATGTAGLAGLMELSERGQLVPGDRVAVVFTGAER